MRLYIAEKPSLARAIADALPGAVQRIPGALRCGSQTVTWCVGHLLEPVEPAHYNPQWKRWRLDTLPILPQGWELQPRADVREQLDHVARLVEAAEEIVHAGDPDREGQLLVDEVLQWCNNRKPVQRVLINDLNENAIRQALANEKPNSRYAPLCASARARQKADWLYGINLSRAYTLHQQQQGGEGVFSVGRVQTPVLGLVVQRDRAIRDFQPQPFFQVDAALSPANDPDRLFLARWQPGDDMAGYLDDEGRLLERAPAEAVIEKIKGQPGSVVQARFRERPEAPPLPLSLSVLQITAARHYGIGAQTALECAQALYEKHQLITYPRSDCRYLPEGHWGDRHEVIAAIGANHPELIRDGVPADTEKRTRAWDDTRVEAHHAIIPTTRRRPVDKLSRQEAAIYDLIARFYLMQFEEEALHREGRLECLVAGERFRATESGVLREGWKRLEPVRRRAHKEGKSEPAPLPRLNVDDAVNCHEGRCEEKVTRAPTPFTEASLLSAMTNIARYVRDESLRRTLRETDGLGTEATRAAILQTLYRREFLRREGRFIHASDRGCALIDALPREVAEPDRTAIWEARLENIRRGDSEAEPFLAELGEDIGRLLSPVLTRHRTAPEQTGIHCPRCRAPMTRRKGKYGEFWSCSRYPQCKGTRAIEPDEPAAHNDGMDQAPVPCPSCYAPMVRRQGPKGAFWGCSQFPACRTTLSDQDGQPAARSTPT